MKTHMQSTKHHEGQSKRQSVELQEHDIATALGTFNKKVHNKGETLPLDMQVYRLKVVSTFLCASILLSKLDFVISWKIMAIIII